MESLAPPLRLIWSVRKSIEKGNGVKMGISEYLKSEPDSWQSLVACWFIRYQQGLSTSEILLKQETPLRQQLLIVLERGLRGESIHQTILQISEEAHFQIEIQIQSLLARLPYLMLIPIALFLFPACAILMLGPFILQLTQAF